VGTELGSRQLPTTSGWVKSVEIQVVNMNKNKLICAKNP
jgi:hypothetical protein